MVESAIKSVALAWVLSSVPLVARTLIIRFKGSFDNTKPRDRKGQEAGLSPGLQQVAVRLLGAHTNQLETLGFYGAAVAVAVAARVPPETLSKLTGYYIKSRIAYNLAYAIPQVAGGVLRSLTFISGIAITTMIYFAAAESASSLY